MSLFDQIASATQPIIELPKLYAPGMAILELEIAPDQFMVYFEYDSAIDMGWWSETDPQFPDGPTYPYWHSDWELKGFRIMQLEKAVGEEFVPVAFMGAHEFEAIYRISKLQAERTYEEETN